MPGETAADEGNGGRVGAEDVASDKAIKRGGIKRDKRTVVPGGNVKVNSNFHKEATVHGPAIEFPESLEIFVGR